MSIQYPAYVPTPGFPEGINEKRVNDDAEHKAWNPAHYEASLSYRPMAPLTTDPAVLRERERCALIAERSSGNAQQIATAIRGKLGHVPPALEEVLAAGYSQEEAQRIVAEQQAKYDAGQPPYGTNVPVEAARPVGPLAVPPPLYRPKLLRDPTKSVMASDKYSVPGTEGQFHYRPDVLVKDAAEEAAARADGYTEEIPAP